MRKFILGTLFLVAVPLAACVQTAETNPFLTFTETFATQQARNNNNNSTGGGSAAEGEFRRRMPITLVNNHPTADLNVSVAAWINPGSIRSADQQDSLLRAGYSQLTSEVKIGSVFTLVPGTFVLSGPGLAGAERLVIPAGQSANVLNPLADDESADNSLITPDVILVFGQPPVSCDSVAFTYEIDGVVIEGPPVSGDIPASSTNAGGRKTFAQVNVYQCQPLKPGLFLKVGGGKRENFEYLEGETIRIDFNAAPDNRGDFAVVSFGG